MIESKNKIKFVLLKLIFQKLPKTQRGKVHSSTNGLWEVNYLYTGEWD